MSDLTKLLDEDQKDFMELIAQTTKKPSNPQNLGDSDSETANVVAAPSSTAIRTKMAPPNNTPLVSHN